MGLPSWRQPGHAVGNFCQGLDRSDAIFTTGGLGPTQDDLTREAIARALGEEMTVEDTLLEDLKGYFRGRGMDMPATNIKQATLIPSARSIPNRRGTAPGWWVEKDGKFIVSMPGPPAEMQGIWVEEVVPRLRQLVRGEVILTRNIKTTGLSEGGLDEMVSQYLGKENPYLGIYAKSDGIHLRIIAKASDEASARELIQPVEDGLVSIVGPYIWGYDDETPEQALGLLLTERNLTLATMESCTGGLLASSITDVPGISAYYMGGLVLYGNSPPTASTAMSEVIDKHGIASQESAETMAQAARQQFGTDIGIGVTGALSPEEEGNRPAVSSEAWGTVHIAIAWDESVRHFPNRLPPRRTTIRRRGASTALIELRRLLNALPPKEGCL